MSIETFGVITLKEFYMSDVELIEHRDIQKESQTLGFGYMIADPIILNLLDSLGLFYLQINRHRCVVTLRSWQVVDNMIEAFPYTDIKIDLPTKLTVAAYKPLGFYVWLECVINGVSTGEIRILHGMLEMVLGDDLSTIVLDYYLSMSDKFVLKRLVDYVLDLSHFYVEVSNWTKTLGITNDMTMTQKMILLTRQMESWLDHKTTHNHYRE